MRGETGSGRSTITIPLPGAVLHRMRRRGPWQLAIEPHHATVLLAVKRGACVLCDPSEGALSLSQGDLVLLIGSGARAAANDAPGGAVSAAAPPSAALRARPASPPATEIVRVDYAGSATLVPGLTGLLRPVVHLRAAHDHGSREIASLLRLIDAEVDRVAPGRHALLGRLLESLFVYAARAALAGAASAPSPGALPIGDGLVARALDLLHARPAERWTVEGLAKAAGLSRAAFARRFAAATGLSPLQYLTQWRMQLSEKLLVETDEPLAAIAARVGYESEFAFSRAFKRHRDVAPGAYRRAHRALLLRAAPRRLPTRAAA